MSDDAKAEEVIEPRPSEDFREYLVALKVRTTTLEKTTAEQISELEIDRDQVDEITRLCDRIDRIESLATRVSALERVRVKVDREEFFEAVQLGDRGDLIDLDRLRRRLLDLERSDLPERVSQLFDDPGRRRRWELVTPEDLTE